MLVWLIRAARFTICVDSGPMHLVAAISSHLVSIHTWSDPCRVGRYNSDARIWKSGQLLRVSELETAKLKRRGRRFKLKHEEFRL
jgi:ADP-heptose:LPS heptosyltransferase